MITGLDHIHYVSNNMEEMVKYFTSIFGVRKFPGARRGVTG